MIISLQVTDEHPKYRVEVAVPGYDPVSYATIDYNEHTGKYAVQCKSTAHIVDTYDSALKAIYTHLYLAIMVSM